MLQSYSRHGYPFFGQPVNHWPNITVPPGYQAPNAAPPGFAPQYIPHPQNAPFVVQPSADGPSTGGPTPRMPLPKYLEAKSFPLKSAMKRSTSGSVPLARQRTVSGPKQDNVPLTRQRTNSQSNTTFQSYHIFVTFRGSNQLVVENISHPDALNELRQELFPLWPPGVDSEETIGTVWRVLFAGNPWSCSGRDALLAWEIITKLFQLLASRGYTYVTSINTGTANPRLVFMVAQPDQGVEFFLAHFSSSGHRLSLINPPAVIIDSLAANLRGVMPRKIASDRVSEDNELVIELKRTNIGYGGYGAPSSNDTQFVTYVLKEIVDMGYHLQTTIPMARRGMLGYKPRKEIWVFRGTKRSY